jgi:3-oxoacyl-[acyl-carrier protein] reductase
VLVSGATGGVGRGIAISCGELGWTVYIAARRKTEGLAVAAEVDAAGGRGRFVECDVVDVESVEHAIAVAVENEQALHGVVHNSTSGESAVPVSFGDVPLGALAEHIRVSARGAYFFARAALPHLAKTSGSLVLMTSEAAIEGKPRQAPYAMVKGAQRGLARSLAREFGQFGVRVNAVAPLATSPALERAFVLDPPMRDRLFGRQPLGRMGDPVIDVGPAIRFLLSDDSRYVNGHTLVVDGGSCPLT